MGGRLKIQENNGNVSIISSLRLLRDRREDIFNQVKELERLIIILRNEFKELELMLNNSIKKY